MNHLNWNDRVEVERVIRDLASAFADADAVVQDLLRPARRRELGPVVHRELYAEARGKLMALLGYIGAPNSTSTVGGAR